ncbi:hypothetical protein [Streptomyces sp. TP-A0874]|uniref:hypothetical protein n=1 Tax=Streptomyces sp. TP-A0874 TaxID=549819 RepID=UPI000853B64F|nr:hypothetical protein [Streptomyces sp. TP-A0874]
MTENKKLPVTELDRFMPVWHFREYHSLRIDAPTEAVIQAAQEATWKEAPVARFFLLFTRNEIKGETRILDQFAADGQTVLSVGGNEFVYGGIGSDEGPHQPERPMAEAYRDFEEPGYTKVGFNVRYADGVLSSETRIYATDTETRNRFGRYWMIIRGPSGLTRKALLKAIKQRVQAG